jgi:hypothetical protein
MAPPLKPGSAEYNRQARVAAAQQETARRERTATQAAQKRAATTGALSAAGTSFRNFTTGVPPGAETDAQGIARRRNEATARTAAAGKKLPKGGNPSGRADQGSADRATVQEFDAKEAARRRAQRSNGVTGSTSGKSNATAQRSTERVTDKPGSLPKPSDQQQPAMEGGPNQRPRISTEGTSSTQKFSIQSFRSEIVENGVLPSHSYLVTFSPFRLGFPENAPLTRFVTQKRNTLVLRCESIVLPAPALLEEENIRRYGYGPVEKIPYGVQFSDVTMTWLVDKNSELVDFMHQWMNTIVMHDSPNASMTPSTNPDVQRPDLTNYSPYEVGYKDGYTNPIVRVYVYNRQNQTVIEYEMYDVFPMNIQSMNLAWADENQDQKLTVTFAYTNMKVKAKMKTNETQLNYSFEDLRSFLTEGRTLNPYEERIQLSDRGGKAAADKARSPGNESATTTAGTSRPNATESTPTAPTEVVVPPNSRQTRTLGP